MEKKEVLCMEYNVFCRVLNHWEEFEKNSSKKIMRYKFLKEVNGVGV